MPSKMKGSVGIPPSTLRLWKRLKLHPFIRRALRLFGIMLLLGRRQRRRHQGDRDGSSF